MIDHRKLSLSTNMIEKIANLNGLSTFMERWKEFAFDTDDI